MLNKQNGPKFGQRTLGQVVVSPNQFNAGEEIEISFNEFEANQSIILTIYFSSGQFIEKEYKITQSFGSFLINTKGYSSGIHTVEIKGDSTSGRIIGQAKFTIF